MLGQQLSISDPVFINVSPKLFPYEKNLKKKYNPF